MRRKPPKQLGAPVPEPPFVVIVNDDGSIYHDGKTVTGDEPINHLCANLIARGFDPKRGLVVRRRVNGHPEGKVELLRLRSIADVPATGDL